MNGMDSLHDGRQEQARLAAMQAAQWLQRMKDDPEAREREAFVAWIDESQLNLREFLFAQAIDGELSLPGLLDGFDVDAAVEAAKAEDNVVALPVMPPARGWRGQPRRRGLWLQGLAASILLVAGLALGPWSPLRPSGQTYSTGIAQSRQVVLEDGSVIARGPASRVRVAFSADTRSLWLESGQASFDVASQPNRPFRVRAGDTVVQAVGTRFDVNRLVTATLVSVSEGRIRVWSEPGNWLQRTFASIEARQAGGEEIAAPAPADAHVADTPHVAPAIARARVDGQGRIALAASQAVTINAEPGRDSPRLDFEDSALADIAELFNRYNRAQIEVADDLGDAPRLSGLFDAGDPESLIAYLQRDPALDVTPAGDGWRIAPARAR